MKLKKCTRCGVVKPVTLKHFSPNSKSKDRLSSWCKLCCNEQKKEFYQQNRKACRDQQNEYYGTIAGYLKTVYSNIVRRTTHSHGKNACYAGVKNLFASLIEFRNHVIVDLQVDPRGLQIDRIDNDGHYEPGNIRFVTAKENCANRKFNKEVS